MTLLEGSDPLALLPPASPRVIPQISASHFLEFLDKHVGAARQTKLRIALK